MLANNGCIHLYFELKFIYSPLKQQEVTIEQEIVQMTAEIDVILEQ